MAAGYQTVAASFGGLPIQNWSPDYSDETDGKANGYFCPLGEESGLGHVIMLASDLDTLAEQTAGFRAPAALKITAGDSITFPALYVEKAVTCSGGAPGNSDRAYLVTLRDVRFLLAQFTDCNLQFNVRRPAPPTLSTDGEDPEEFYETTLNGGEPYTWQDCVNALVAKLGGMWGGSAVLPSTPDGQPENLQFVGVSAWSALHVVLNKLDMTTAYDPTSGLFAIVSQGGTQPGLAAAELSHDFLLDDGDPYGNDAFQFPATFRVYFHKRSAHFGTEQDTTDAGNAPNDAFNLVYSIDLPTGRAEAIAGTVKAVWDDLPAIVDYGTGGQLLYLNGAELAERAAARLETWLAKQESNADRMRRVYQGIAAGFVPGSQVQSVEWSSVGFEGDDKPRGWMTSVIRRPDNDTRRSPDLIVGKPRGGELSAAAESIAPPDYARHTVPVWPRNVQLIRITNRAPDELGYYSAVVVRRTPDPQGPVAIEPCLALEATGAAVRRRETCGVYFGRLNGTAISAEGEVLPLYMLESGAGQILLGKPIEDIGHNEVGTLQLWDGPAGFETLITPVQEIELYNTGPAIKAGDSVWFTNDCSGPRRLPTSSPAVLGRVKDDPGIKNKDSGTIKVFGGTPGSESQQVLLDGSLKTLNVYNKFFGYLPKDAWVIAQDDGDGYYVTDTIQGDHLLGRIEPSDSPATVDAFFPPLQVTVQIQTSDQAVSYGNNLPNVQAFVRNCPVIQGEQVEIVWTGSIFTIVGGEFDGGILGKTESTISKGGSGLVQVALTGDDPNVNFTASIKSPLGQVAGGKLIWIARNKNGFYVASAEC